MTLHSTALVERTTLRRGPLFQAVQKAVRDGMSRRSFAARTGLTSAELIMVERAIGVRLPD
jgi:hypothetical protein